MFTLRFYKSIIPLTLIGLLISTNTLIAEVQLTSVTPGHKENIATNDPEIMIQFSAPIDPSTATSDSVRLYRLGDDSLTPGPDDTQIAIGPISVTDKDTTIRFHANDPLLNGQYAIVAYSMESDRSGPGYCLDFNRGKSFYSIEPFKTLGDEFTLEAWTQWHQLPTGGSHSWGAIFDVGQNDRWVPGFWLMHRASDLLFGFLRVDGSNDNAEALDVLPLDEWVHLAGVSSTEGLKIYINGQLEASTSETFRPIDIADHIELAICGYSRWAGADDYIDAAVDELRVWNIARSESQLKATMHTPLSGSESGLVLYHPLDRQDGDILIDESSNSYDGTRGTATRVPSDAPMIELAKLPIRDTGLALIDIDNDSNPGGILISEFTIDTTAPKIVGMLPSPIECDTLFAVSAFSFELDDELNPSTVISDNIQLIGSGGDGLFDNGNDNLITLKDVSYNPIDRVIQILFSSPLPTDMYLLTLIDQIKNVAGTSLDGEYPGTGGLLSPLPTGDEIAGGNFVIQFQINDATDCNDNLVADVCELTNNDCDHNQIPDDCEPDCNEDGITDTCDFLAGANDCNNNTIPDSCEISLQNYVLDFDGADDWLRIPRAQHLEPTDELTIETWVRMDSSGSSNSRIVRSTAPFASGYILSVRQSGSPKLELRIDSATDGGCRATDPTPLSTYFGQWIHIAGVYSASKNLCQIYVNGQLKDSKPAVGALRYSDSDLYFGNSSDGNEGFDGQIDEVRIWEVARTHESINQFMHKNIDGAAKGLVGYWKMEAGEGQVVYDSSSYFHHGMMGVLDNPEGDVRDPTWVLDESPVITTDCNDNETLDVCEIEQLASEDCNNNLIPDECEAQDDCNDNNTQDICDLATEVSPDCNLNGIPDECDLDSNSDGIPDDCDIFGDFDLDRDVDNADYEIFNICLVQSGPGNSPPFASCLEKFDSDLSETIDLRDFSIMQISFTGSQ